MLENAFAGVAVSPQGDRSPVTLHQPYVPRHWSDHKLLPENCLHHEFLVY
jgi:hypothetical protein